MDEYLKTTSSATQNGGLLDATEQVIYWAHNWLRGLKSKYTEEMGCGLKRLPTKHIEEVPVFDGLGGELFSV